MQRTAVIDRGVVLTDGNGGGVQGVVGASPHELLFDQIAAHAGSIPNTLNDVTFFEAPRLTNTGLGALKLARYGNDYLDSQFENGSDGSLFEFELIYYSDRTVDDNKESLKLSPNQVKEIDIRDMGDEKEAYRWNYILKNNTDRDDFRRIIELAKAFSLTGEARDRASQQVMDIDQWARTVALISLTGVGDTYMMNLNHNLQLYVRPEDNKVLMFPWDYDFAFFQSTRASLLGTRRTNLTPILELPHNRRRLYGHMLDLIRTSYNTNYLGPWIEEYTRLTEFPDLVPFLNDYIERRSSYVLDQLDQLAPRIPFEVVTGGGEPIEVDAAEATIEGRGWIDVHSVRLADTDETLPVTWLDQQRWQVTLPVTSGENRFVFQAYDFQGRLVGEDRATVISTLGDPLRDGLRITEVNYHPYDALPQFGDLPVDSDRFEFIELTNVSPNRPAALAGVTFSRGIDYTLGDLVLPPGERVVVVRDREAFVSRYGTDVPIAGEYRGKLSNSGETVRLDDPSGRPLVEFTYRDGDFDYDDIAGLIAKLNHP